MVSICSLMIWGIEFAKAVRATYNYWLCAIIRKGLRILKSRMTLIVERPAVIERARSKRAVMRMMKSMTFQEFLR